MKKTPRSAEALLRWKFKNYKTIFRTRADALDHLFFTIGNGYRWDRGALVATDETGLRPRQRLPPKGIMREIMQELRLDEAALPVGPIPDPGGKRRNYPVCDYSRIMCVPDDVRPDWLALAKEAAVLLRDRSDTAKNRAIGKRIAAQLEKRFPARTSLPSSVESKK